MTRTEFDDFKAKLEAVGRKSFGMYVTGGNNTIVHEDPSEYDKPTGLIIDKGDYIIAYQRTRDYMSSGRFEVYFYPLDMADGIFIRGLSTKDLINFVGDDMDDDIKAFISNAPAKRMLNPEATPTIGEEAPVHETVVSQYHKEETVKSGTGMPESKYHTINDIENLPKTESEVETVPPRKDEEEEDGE